MSFINFSFTQHFTDAFFVDTAQLRVGFSREGGRLETIERSNVDGTFSKVEHTPEIVAAASAVKQAIISANWLDSVDVTRRAPGAPVKQISWTERHGASGSAPTAATSPSNVQQAIEAATLLANVAQRTPVAKPFAPHA